MKVTVRLGEPIWRVAGALRLELEFEPPGVTVADVLAHLAAAYPGFETAFRGDDLARHLPYQLFVNARIVPPGSEHERFLADGDKLYVFLPAAGGNQGTVLGRDFYARNTLEVARGLLGRRLVRTLDGQRVGGPIVEVEAYVGADDLASHAARGQTPRNRAMFGRAGHAYVYFIYGMYHCLNVVTEAEGYPAAVLIRAIEPVEGVQVMAVRRPGRPRSQLANGPGKLCQALAIGRDMDGLDLTAGVELWLEAGQPVDPQLVQATPRVNVRGDRRARTMPWRFVVQGK
jgi:DNA-3-methyladenine glycosylase